MPERMKQKNRQKNHPRLKFGEIRQEIDPSGNPEHQGTEQKVDRENIHRVPLAALPLDLEAELDETKVSDSGSRAPPSSVTMKLQEPAAIQHNLRALVGHE
jgi:hypothetical protein